MDLNKLTAARLIALHNALVTTSPLPLTTDKAKAIAACTSAVVAPKQIAAAIKDTPFNVRQALRAARKDKKVTHTMKSRWELTPAFVIELFPKLSGEPVTSAQPKAKLAKGLNKKNAPNAVATSSAPVTLSGPTIEEMAKEEIAA